MVIKREDPKQEKQDKKNETEQTEILNPMGDTADGGVPEDVPSEDTLSGTPQTTSELPLSAIVEGVAKKEKQRRLSFTGATRMGTPAAQAPRVAPARELVSPKLFWAVAAVCCVVIALFAGRFLMLSDGPVVLGDELGYWGNAAIFTGRDWHDIMEVIPFYAFGYSLLLVPLFWLGLPMAVMYKIAIVLNIAMLLLAFVLAYCCLRRLFTALLPIPALLIAGATILYTNTLAQAQAAWGETLLYLLYWAMLWLVLRLLEKPSVKWTMLLAVCGGYMYMVHMRTIGVMIALCMTMLLFFAAKRIDWKQLLSFALVFALMVVIQNLIKTWTNNNIYTGELMAGVNDYSSQVGNLFYAFTTVGGCIELLQSVCGKLFYTGSATFLLGIVSLRLLFADFFGALWQWLRSGLRQFKARRLPSAFLLLSFGGTFMVNAIAMHGFERLDLPVYGRYMEFAFGPLIAIGLALLVLGRVGIGQALGCGGVLLATSFVTNNSFNLMLDQGTQDFNAICAITFARMVNLLDAGYNTILIIALLSLAVFFIMWGGQYACGRYLEVGYASPRRKKLYRVLRPLLRTLCPIVVASLAWLWCYGGFYGYRDPQVKTTNRMGQVQALVDAAGSNPSCIYWVYEDAKTRNNQLTSLQIRLGCPFKNITTSEFRMMELDPDALYLTGVDTVSNNDAAERCQKIISNDIWNIYTVPGSRWATAAGEMPLVLVARGGFPLLYGTAAENAGATGQADEATTRLTVPQLQQRTDGIYQSVLPIDVQSSGVQGAVLTSGSVDLPAGQYEINFVLTLQSGAATKLGELTLYDANDNRLQTLTLRGEDFAPGVRTSISMHLNTMLDQSLNGVYFQFYSESGVKITLNETSYARVGEATEVISADSAEMDALGRLLELDYENHPLYVLPRASQMERASLADLQSTFPDRAISLEQNLNLLAEEPGILLIPTDRRSTIYQLLAGYTIAEKLGNYTVMLPTGSTAESEFIGHGGIPMSENYYVQLRYYAANNSETPGTVVATPPAGTYRLLMRPSFSNQMIGYYGTMTVAVDEVVLQTNELDKGTERDASFYMPLELTVDGTQQISVVVNKDTNANLSDMNVSLRLIGDTAITYGDNNN